MALQPNQIVLKNVRSAFLVLGAPEDYQGNKRFRRSATALIPYNSPQLKEIEAKMRAVAEAKWGKKGAAIYEAVISDKQTTCIIDGKKKPDYDGFEGHFALTAHRPVKDGRPMVLDTDLSVIYPTELDVSKRKEARKTDPELAEYKLDEAVEGKVQRIYAGCMVNMKIGFWCQDNDNGKAIRAELITVQSLFKGDSFGGGAKVSADEFESVEEGADDEDLG
jgi:hypothetical protein